MTMLQTAERIAREAHEGQVEKWGGHAYIVHVERVVAMVEGDDVKAVAWLHDVIEDTPLTDFDLLQAGLPRDVVDAVVLLSRGDETYAEYIETLKARKNPLALAVKVADLRDHLREETLDRLPTSMVRRYEAALWKLTT